MPLREGDPRQDPPGLAAILVPKQVRDSPNQPNGLRRDLSTKQCHELGLPRQHRLLYRQCILDKSSFQDIRSIQGADRPDGTSTRPVWLDDAVEAAKAELRAAERKRPTELGRAKRQQEGATPLHARFEVDVREQGGLSLDGFDELKLQAADGSTFPVLEVLVQERDRLVVLASARATGELVLLASRDPRFILERLCERLEALREPGLAAALAGGSPTTTRVKCLEEQPWPATAPVPAALPLDDAAQQAEGRQGPER